MLGPRSFSLAVAALVSAVSFIAAPSVSATPPAAHWEASEFTLEPLSGPLAVGGEPYRGRFHLRLDGGSVRLINEVNVEDYLRGVREMPPSWPIEAQRAQAIAARSYALHQALVARAEGRQWDLCATASCQVYGGIGAERQGGTAWAHAVDSTESEVLAYRGVPILAMYSSSNGGRTVAASQPYLRSVPDPDDAASPHHRWRVEVPETAIGAAVDLPEGAQLTGLERAGGVVVARWAGPEPDVPETARPIPVAEFRTRLEAAQPPPVGLPRLLPSTAFGVAPSPDPGRVVIEGRGWGHGIGMSQHGALGKARRGLDARRILAAYYAGLTPVRAPAGRVPDTVRIDLGASPGFDLGGLGAFRVVAGGQGVATGAESQGWKVAVRRGALVLTAPRGWEPPQPANPQSSSDPIEVLPGASAPTSELAAVVAPTTAVEPGDAWGGFALLLVLAVGGATFRLRDRPDPVPFPRG
ncbi:MAG TPA: SpoIID/LytB domain-containing protein [Acidimicrobiales bacterium]|nr:SpoIID/LytB domain-containing protein [Acidimicrobiales bacterium]